jgi:hypothetical protein
LSITILVPPGNSIGAVGEPEFARCPQEDAESSDLETRFAHLSGLVLLGQSMEELVNATIIAIGSNRCPQAPQEFGMTDNIQDAASVRD